MPRALSQFGGVSGFDGEHCGPEAACRFSPSQKGNNTTANDNLALAA
jgi:hypothetical protein